MAIPIFVKPTVVTSTGVSNTEIIKIYRALVDHNAAAGEPVQYMTGDVIHLVEKFVDGMPFESYWNIKKDAPNTQVSDNAFTPTDFLEEGLQTVVSGITKDLLIETFVTLTDTPSTLADLFVAASKVLPS